MDDPYLLVDPEGAQAFLSSFAPVTRQKGEALLRRGALEELVAEEAGSAYTACVRADERECWVKVFYAEAADGSASWMGECSCSGESDCEHVFAAVRELLAYHSAAVVRDLSANTQLKEDRRQRIPPGLTKSAAADLAKRLSWALARVLTRDEALFVKKVQAAYARCRQSQQITNWDFQEMGLSLKDGYSWDPVRIWPAPPANEHEFWLYVANTARERGTPIPGFMEPITDLHDVRERMSQWKRSREIEHWKKTLGALSLHTSSAKAGDRTVTDLRLIVHPDELAVEWQRVGQSGFLPLKVSQLRQLQSDFESDQVLFTPEAEWIWQVLNDLLGYGITLRWQHISSASARILGRLLRMDFLNSRIVRPSGEPLARPTARLRWQLMPATSCEEDYQFTLAQAGGSRVPPLLATLPGSPTLYLTNEAVFLGPKFHPTALKPDRDNRIPAPALETAAGVGLLENLEIALPPRLVERVRHLPYQVAIHCELRPSWKGSTTEDCVVRVVAEAADGKRMTWLGYNWMEETPRLANQSQRRDGTIVLYDSSLLAKTSILLAQLQLKPGSYADGMVLRVTKKFPEIFASWLETVPKEISVYLAGDLASFAQASVSGRVKLDVSEVEIDWFDLRVVLDVSDATLSKEEIHLLLKAKGSYVRLAGKGWRRLQFDLSDDENAQLARLGLSARELSAEPQRLHALQLADDAAKSFLAQRQVERIQRRAEEIKTRVAPALPAGIQAELRPYQVEGFHFLAYLSTNRFGGILADDMGLGKTLQTLAWLVWLRESNAAAAPSQEPNSAPTDGSRPVLVACPKSVMDNWRAEAARFAPSLRVKLWPGHELDQLPAQLGSADLHVINYNQLRTLGESLASVRWLAVILDEGQYIKNPSSQTAQVARALRAEYRLVLSGTPIENRLLDLWSLMAFVMPGVLSSRAQFARLYDAKGDPLARRRLAARVRPFLLRRTKSQVAKDLPDRIEEDLFCEIEGEQQTLYRAELKRAQQLLLGIKTQKELAQQQFHFLVSLLRLRQICCDPRLLNRASEAPSAKTEALLDQLEPLMEEGHKVLVFSQFVELLNLLRPLLTERQWQVFYLAGDTENRGELVQSFQSAEGAAVFLISLKAGGFGLNLTAASYVVLFDPWWNPAVENQAIDRTHRIGQVNKVIAYRLLIKNSIEEKIRELQKKKSALAQDVLGEENFAQNLTLEDLHFLFAD